MIDVIKSQRINEIILDNKIFPIQVEAQESGTLKLVFISTKEIERIKHKVICYGSIDDYPCSPAGAIRYETIEKIIFNQPNQ